MIQHSRLIALALTLAATPAVAQTPTIEQAKSLARREMVSSLRDPASARFRNVLYSRASDGRIIFCGEINARNGMRGYTGFVPFITSVTSDLEVNSEIAEERDLSARMLVSSAWGIVCEGEGVRNTTL